MSESDKDTKTQQNQPVSGSQEDADRASEKPLKKPDSDQPEEHQDDLLDEAVEETFPASDPISPKQIT